MTTSTPLKASQQPITISEELGVKRMTSQHPVIKKLKKEHPTSIHGDKFWSSSYLLMDYLNDNPP
ncbi:MAG: hypothetical protein QMB64_03800 [Pseudomonadales bacterium]